MNKYTTDWLASRPVFYNEKTLKISHNVNDVIDYSDIEFHPEGFNNYLDFGYSVFQQTPLKHVKFLRHSSEIWLENNELKIVEKPDPVIKWFEDNPGYKEEEEVLELIQRKVREWEKKTRGDIVLPLSGGYDSRLLAYFIQDKSRLKAFTYGVSNKQEESYEVVKAREISRRLGINWKQIELGDYHKYFNQWDELFGVSIHSHGMYHIEFYKKMKEYLRGGELFLSGIFGDVWAGSVQYQNIEKAQELSYLGYTHSLVSDSRYSKLDSPNIIRQDYYDKNKEQIDDYRKQIILTIRIKIILISYLMSLPRNCNLKPWSPYLDMEVALSMLSINPERKKGRKWQKDFFKKIGLDLEISKLSINKINNLNHQAMGDIPLKPLNLDLLSEVVEEKYINWINKILLETPFVFKIIPKLKASNLNPLFVRKFTEGLKKIGFGDKVLEAYYAYLTLKPIENVLYKRDKYLKQNKT